MATVVMELNKENQAIFRNQKVAEFLKEDGVKFGLWKDGKIVAAFGQSNEWHFFGHRVSDITPEMINEGHNHKSITFK